MATAAARASTRRAPRPRRPTAPAAASTPSAGCAGSAARSASRVTLLRIPGIYAPGRAGGDPRARLARGTPVLAAADDVYTNHIHADDLARACVAALWRGRPQRAVHVNDDSEMPMGDYFDLAADLAGLPRPPRIARTEAAALLSPQQQSFSAESRRLDNRRLKTELRLRLRYPTVVQGLAALQSAPAAIAAGPERIDAPRTPRWSRRPRLQHGRVGVELLGRQASRLTVAPMKTLLLTHPLPAAPFVDAIHALDPGLPLVEYRAELDDTELAEVEAALGWSMPAGLAAAAAAAALGLLGRRRCREAAGARPRAAGCGVAHRRRRTGARHRAVRRADGLAPCT